MERSKNPERSNDRPDAPQANLVGLIATLTAVAVVLIEVLVAIADVGRWTFNALSLIAGLLCAGLATWFWRDRYRSKSYACIAGVVAVLVLAVTAAPDNETPIIERAAESQSASTSLPDTNTSLQVNASTSLPANEVVQEQPREADALFSRAMDSPIPWYNQIAGLFAPKDSAREMPESEAVVLGTWWALSDWCVKQSDESPGRCYDLAAFFVLDTFGRDPRTISDDDWYGVGAIGDNLITGYELTAAALGLEVEGKHLPDLIKGRPGTEWSCEPTCVDGYSNWDLTN